MMIDKPDGTFLVRDASSKVKGEYTLTLRIEGNNRLIRILHRGGRYGFSEPLAFFSVIDLIQHHHDRSLAQYNSTLDTQLLYPVSRYQQVEQDISAEAVAEQLRLFQERSREYDLLCDEFTHTSQGKGTAIEAFTERIRIFEEQCEQQEHYGKEYMFLATGSRAERVLNSPEDLQSQVEKIHNNRIRLAEELRSELVNMQLDRELNALKAELGHLNKIRDQYLLWLAQQGPSPFGDCLGLKNEDEDLYATVDGAEGAGRGHSDERRWYAGAMRRAEAEALLEGRRDGTFLIRESETRSGSLACSVVVDGTAKHCVIYRTATGYGFTEPYNLYPSLRDLVLHYRNTSLTQHNQQLNVTLAWPALSQQPS